MQAITIAVSQNEVRLKRMSIRLQRHTFMVIPLYAVYTLHTYRTRAIHRDRHMYVRTYMYAYIGMYGYILYIHLAVYGKIYTAWVYV